MQGCELKAWRVRHAMYQGEAAQALGFGESTIRNWEKNGVTGEIMIAKLRKAMQAVDAKSSTNLPAKSPGRPGKLLEVPMRTRQGKQIFTEAEFAALTERWILPEGATDWHYSALEQYGRKSGWVPRYWPDSHERVTLLDSPALTDEDFASVIAEWDALKSAKPLHPNYNAELARINATEGKAWSDREDDI